MSDSNIFVFYPDGSGNVTISTRLGAENMAPGSQDSKRVQLLAGSGVEEGVMTANVACFNCESWAGGEMDLRAESSDWIAAWREGNTLDTANADVEIELNDGVEIFQLNLKRSRIPENANPFVKGTAYGPGGGNYGALGFDDDDGRIGEVDLVLVHGVIMFIAFLVLYPIGAMLTNLGSKWYIHAGCQFLAFLVMWAGAATGYVKALADGWVSSRSLLPKHRPPTTFWKGAPNTSF